MCVEIIKELASLSYDSDLPLEEQVRGSKEIIIDCDQKDCPKVEKFLDEVERICKSGLSLPIKLKTLNNNSLNLFRKTKRLNKDLTINDIITKIVAMHKTVDKGLEEISETCAKGRNGR